MHAVKALCELHSPDALKGLYAWCKEEAGKRMPWIKAAAELAGGKSVLISSLPMYSAIVVIYKFILGHNVSHYDLVF